MTDLDRAARRIDAEIARDADRAARGEVDDRVEERIVGERGLLDPAEVVRLVAERTVGEVGPAAAFPVEVEGAVRAVVYVENRFQPLDLSREALRIALGYARAIGCLLEVERLRKENASLWVDITRLRERELSVPAAAAARPRLESRRMKRIDLKGDYSSIIGSSPRMAHTDWPMTAPTTTPTIAARPKP